MSVIASQLIGKVAIEGAEKAQSDLKGVGEHAKETESSFKKLREQVARGFEFGTGMQLAQIPGSIFDAAKEQVVDIIKLAMDHQQILAQTNQVLKSTHDVSRMTADALDELAQKFGKTTQFSADTVQQGENLLLTFTNIGHDVFPQATQAILDVSQAMGQDLKESAIQVGKALGDPLTGMTALQRIGVTFSAQEKEQIKTMMAHHDVIGAQKVILKELATEFGGSAQAAGKTFAGALKIASDRVEEIKIKIGTALMPILNEFLGYFEQHMLPRLEDFSNWFQAKGIPKLQQFGEWFQKDGIPALEDFGGKIATVAGWVADFVQGLKDGDPWLSALAGGLTAVGTAIGLLKLEDFGVGLYNSFQKMQEGAGIVANLASRELPNLSEALGWTKVAAQDTSIAVEGVGTAATEAETVTATAATGMTVAMGIATAGISLAIGTIAALWLATQHEITVNGNQMSQDVQKEYDAMGNSAADNAAKAQAKQTEAATDTSKEIKNQGSRVSEYWVSSYDKASQAADNARAKMILDAQQVADATAAAQKQWSDWVNSMWAQGIDVVHGGKVPTPGPTTLPGGAHPVGHATGILNSPVGHWATVGEQGPETMFIPRGASILPSDISPPAIGGQGGMLYATLTIDGMQFARVIAPYSTDHMRYSLGSVGW